MVILVKNYKKIKDDITMFLYKRDENKFLMEYSVQDSRALMEYLINQALSEWQIYNIDPDIDSYMTEEKIKDSIEYIIKKIITELTYSSRLKLSVGYPMGNQEEMIESIKNRAKIAVLNLSIQQNNPTDVTRLPNINAF